jgi:hypothetical protein
MVNPDKRVLLTLFFKNEEKSYPLMAVVISYYAFFKDIRVF